MKIDKEYTIKVELSKEEFELIKQGIAEGLKNLISKDQDDTTLYEQLADLYEHIELFWGFGNGNNKRYYMF